MFRWFPAPVNGAVECCFNTLLYIYNCARMIRSETLVEDRGLVEAITLICVLPVHSIL